MSILLPFQIPQFEEYIANLAKTRGLSTQFTDSIKPFLDDLLPPEKDKPKKHFYGLTWGELERKVFEKFPDLELKLTQLTEQKRRRATQEENGDFQTFTKQKDLYRFQVEKTEYRTGKRLVVVTKGALGTRVRVFTIP